MIKCCEQGAGGRGTMVKNTYCSWVQFPAPTLSRSPTTCNSNSSGTQICPLLAFVGTCVYMHIHRVMLMYTKKQRNKQTKTVSRPKATLGRLSLVTPHLQSRAKREQTCPSFLALSYLSPLLYSSGPTPWNGTTHHGLHFPTSINNQDDPLQTSPQANLKTSSH